MAFQGRVENFEKTNLIFVYYVIKHSVKTNMSERLHTTLQYSIIKAVNKVRSNLLIDKLFSNLEKICKCIFYQLF